MLVPRSQKNYFLDQDVEEYNAIEVYIPEKTKIDILFKIHNKEGFTPTIEPIILNKKDIVDYYSFSESMSSSLLLVTIGVITTLLFFLAIYFNARNRCKRIESCCQETSSF